MKLSFLPCSALALVASLGSACSPIDVCSDEPCFAPSLEAPRGASLRGAELGDTATSQPAIAIGGTTTFRVEPVYTEVDVIASDPRIAEVQAVRGVGTGAEVVTTYTATVAGIAAGKESLRVVNRRTREEIVESQVSVAALDRASVIVFDSTVPDARTAEPVALLAGAHVDLVVQLAAADGTRLVDEGLTFTPATGPATRRAWDRFNLVAPAAPGDTAIALTAAGRSFEAHVTTVAAIDQVEALAPFSSLASGGQLRAGESRMLCFHSRSGGVLTAGATWTFTATPNVKVMPMGACVGLQGTAAGVASLDVDASGVHQVVHFTVTP